MATKKVIDKNPYEGMPTCLVRVTEQLFYRHGHKNVRDEAILNMVREISALLPSKWAISDKEACRMVKEAVGWRASYRAEKKYRPRSTDTETPARRVARTSYCLPRALFPIRRYVPEGEDDPLERAGRWQNIYDVSSRINDLVGWWWGQMWRLAFGDIPKIYPWVACFTSTPPHVRHFGGYLDASNLRTPLEASRIYTLDIDKGFLRRIRVAGLCVSDGFLPVDAIIDDLGRVTRVIAFRRHGDTILLESLAPDDLTT